MSKKYEELVYNLQERYREIREGVEKGGELSKFQEMELNARDKRIYRQVTKDIEQEKQGMGIFKVLVTFTIAIIVNAITEWNYITIFFAIIAILFILG